MNQSEINPHKADEINLYSFGRFSKARVETLSDGVFAIILTLLVLELKVPHIEDVHSGNDLWMALLKIKPKFLSWVISFLMVCVVWINHHRLFDQFKGINNGLFWYNANLLMWTSFIPFPTALIGDYPHNKFALFAFGILLSMAALSFTFMRMYVQKEKNKELLADFVDIKIFRAGTKLSFFYGGMAYWIAASLAWINPWIAFAIYFFIPVYFIFPKASKAN
jgi:uncharacterized membrane protein